MSESRSCPNCRSTGDARRRPSRWAQRLRLRRGSALAAAVVLLASGVPALAQGFNGLSSGLWDFTRTASAQPPSTQPSMSMCLDARAAQDPSLLVGEAPGDTSCRIRAPRRTDQQTVVAELECPDGRRLRAVARFTSPDQFVTRVETLVGRPHDPNPAFIHARRVQPECTR